MKRILLFSALLLSFYSNFASAFWYFGNPNGTSAAPTPLEACSRALAAPLRTDVKNLRISPAVIPQGTTVVSCFYDEHNGWGWLTSRLDISSTGSSCVLPSEYDPNTGGCTNPNTPDGAICTDESVPPPRVYQAGTCINLGTATKGTKCKYYATGGTANTTPRVYWLYEGKGDFSQQLIGKDASGCETRVDNPDLQKDCKYTPEMVFPAQPGAGEGGSDLPGYTQPGTYKCKFSATLTGNVSPEGGSSEPTDKICTEPGSPRCALQELPKEAETKPCTYTTSADGSQVCASSTKETKPGSTSCGYVGATWTCKDDLPKAVGKGLTIATKVTTEPTSDGKTKITKTDTLYDTTCKGTPAACSTKSSVSTTTTIKSAGGQTESVSGSCTGPHCADSNTNPDGNGDGFGDCTGDDCSDGEGGDGVLTPELDDVPTFSESTKKFTDDIQGVPLVSAIRNIRAPSGVCPTFSADTGLLGVVDYGGHCEVLEPNRNMITLIAKLVWSFLAVMILFG